MFAAETDTALMISWIKIVDIGHTTVMVPMASAIAAWLIAGRAWKMALCWCLIFTATLSVVALSKIAFLGWGIGIPSLNFKALSGHATRATTVIPVFFFIALQQSSISVRRAGVFFGIAFGLFLGVLLIGFKFHTPSEVIASCILGSFVSLGFIRISTTLPVPRVNHWIVPVSMIAFLVIWCLKPSSINHWLVDVVLYLSGRDQPYS